MFNFIQNLRRKWQEPSVYAVVTEGDGMTLMHLGVHYSLDEAFQESRKELTKRKPDVKRSEFSLWTSVSLRDIVGKYVIPPNAPVSSSSDSKVAIGQEDAAIVPPPDTGGERNSLIQALIHFKDVGALSEPFASNLTENERKYILSKIAGKEATKVK